MAVGPVAGQGGDMAEQTTTFGYFLIPNADDPLIETARRVEQLGLDDQLDRFAQEVVPACREQLSSL